MNRGIDAADAAGLARQFDSRLVTVTSPVGACLADSASAECSAALTGLTNPYVVEDDPGAYHTTGWLGAFESRHSPFAVAVETAADIAATIGFARDRGIRLAVKGTGHDYLGRSCAPDSLLVWTHAMREVTVHDAFTPAGGEGGVPAVTVGAGTRWLEVYQALAGYGRYAQGGGCTTVGAAGGFTQGGGFGHFSRQFGTAAGNMLEAEVVTAGGDVVVANAHQHADLFWALRGGGGGTFGVVSKMTLRTHPMPGTVSLIGGAIRAASDTDYHRLLGMIVRLYADLDYHWGEQIHFGPDNTVQLFLLAAGLSDDDVCAVWQPLLDRIGRQPQAYATDVTIATGSFGGFWDPRWWQERAPQLIRRDERSGQPPGTFWWTANDNELCWYLNAYQSRWIPAGLFREAPDTLADALFRASRIWPFGIHAEKSLYGAPAGTLERERATSVNPAAREAAALVIAVAPQRRAFPGVPGHEPDPHLGAARARRVGEAMDHIRAVTPGSGSYVNETDYFEPDWQRSLWGANYPRLLEIKHRYDPDGVFRVHHGVGSEEGDIL